MASSKEYLSFILEQLSEVDGVGTRAMMGEYLIYVQGALVGGIYDDSFLLKPVPSALEMLKEVPLVEPYPGAKKMLLVDKLEDKCFLKALLETAAGDILESKGKKRG
ncbi:MAG: TfoX/Sxy family protein [Clostridia bacterium]|nr:TfoX/Sxy family protein [Clostridia bacterium]